MDLQNLYTKMTNDSIITNEYQIIVGNEKLGGYATHDLSHINRVISYCEKIAKLLKLNDRDIAGIKIAALLHDIGNAQGGKGGHAERSYEWSKNYLKEVDDETREKILYAIRDHSGDGNDIYGKILAFADKIDICDKRILPEGLQIFGNRQYAHILSTDFNIKENKLTVEFKTDGQININEMKQYYFTEKVFQSIKSLADFLTLDYEIIFT